MNGTHSATINHFTELCREKKTRVDGSSLRCGIIATLLVLVAGCAGPDLNQVTLETVGPIDGGYIGRRGTARGFLQVFSATTPVNDGGIVYNVHTPYSVYTPEGKHFKGVPNHVGPDDQKPMTIELPPGRYQVFAQAPGFGQVKVPIAIDSMRLTAVYLDRLGRPPLIIADIPPIDAVRLPDGRVVGRRVKLAAETPANP